MVAGQLPPDHPQTPVIKRYVKDYYKMYRINPSGMGASAYDAVYVISEAMKESLKMPGGVKPQNIRRELEKVKY